MQKESYLQNGKDYDILRGRDLEDLKQLIKGMEKDYIPFASVLTIFYETALTAFVGTRNNKTGKRLREWIYTEVIPSIRKTGRYDMTEAAEQRLLEHATREKQVQMSKEIAALLGPMYGAHALQIYYSLTTKGFTGQTPKALVDWAKAHGVPSKVYSRGSREILRYLFPSIPPCMSVQDQLVLERMPPDKAHKNARLLMPFFVGLAEDGFLDKTSLASTGQQMIFQLDLPDVNQLPNPFRRALPA